MEALLASFKRPARYGMWYHVLETVLPSGKSRVLATLCSRKSADQLVVTLQNSQDTKKQLVYSIDPTPISEPMRRCDKCMC